MPISSGAPMKAYPSGATALRGGYLVKNIAVNTVLRARDGFLRLVTPSRSSVGSPTPRRIVVAVGGHLGDGVIATSVLAQLAGAFPGAEIGVVCPSATAVVFEGHPLVTRIHRFDHWLSHSNRRSLRAAADRWRAGRGARQQAARELRSSGYDAAVDLYPFFPNHGRLFRDAGIPVRVGYTSGGGGPLLTHPVAWSDSRLHTADQHLRLLRAWRPEAFQGGWAYDLPPFTPADRAEGKRLLGAEDLDEGEYVVVHPGTANPLKAWPTTRWEELLRGLTSGGSSGGAARGIRVVLTGSGPAEQAVVNLLLSAIPEAISLCNRTSWQTFRYVIANARAVVGSDSVASHVAGAHGVRSVAIMAAMSDPEHWRAPGAVALTAPVSCAPCFQSRGCATMACVRTVTVAQVDVAVRDSLQEVRG